MIYFLAVGPLILVATGWSGSSQSVTQVVNVSSSSVCSPLTPFPRAVRGAEGTVLDGNPIVCGGYDGQSYTSCYMYNKDSSSWDLHSDMSNKRGFFGMELNNGALMVIGGYSSSPISSIEYIYGNGSLSSEISLPVARHGHATVALHDGRVMVIGASSPSSGSSQSTSTRLVGQIRSGQMFKQF